MNTIGIHAMVLVSDWDAAGAETAIRKAAGLGYDLIEVPLFDPAGTDLARTRALLSENRIKAAVSLGLTPAADVSSEDPAVAAAGVKQLQAVVEGTATIGGRTVAGVMASAWQKYKVPATAKGYANAVAGIREVAQGARAHGVQLAVEVVNRFESNLFNTTAQALRFVDAVGEDNVGLHLDTFHMHIEEPDPAAAIMACGDRLFYFHVNENHRGYLDTGSIDFPRYFRALAKAGYTGVVSFEAFSANLANPAVAANAAVWRDVYEDGEDVARQALGYLRAGLGSAATAVKQATSA